LKKRGRGVCLVAHPGGTRYGGGDPNQAIIKLKLDGTVELLIGTVDIGQGSSMVFRQITAEKLQVALDKIGMITADTSSGAYCSGTQASRAMFSCGNAIIAACDDFIRQLQQFGAKIFNTEEENINIDHGFVVVKSEPEKKMSYAQFSKYLFDQGDFVVGQGSYMMRKFRPMDPEGGFFEGSGNIAFGAMVMDIDVDTKTGQIDIINVYLAQDAGMPLNKIICEGQVEGGLVHSIGMTLMENLYPYYPETDFMPKSFRDYIIPTAKDIPQLQYVFVGGADPSGPYGAKGFSEMGTHYIAAAMGEAIYNAIGVWITSLPITPEKVLRALDAKETCNNKGE